MGQLYRDTAQIWRPQNEMRVGLLNLGLLLAAFVATYIFMKGYEGRGWREGLRFGLLMTGLFLSVGLITYSTQPMPLRVIVMWTLGDLISYSVGGSLLGLVLRFSTKSSDTVKCPTA